jgi:hypothetical protein
MLRHIHVHAIKNMYLRARRTLGTEMFAMGKMPMFQRERMREEGWGSLSQAF